MGGLCLLTGPRGAAAVSSREQPHPLLRGPYYRAALLPPPHPQTCEAVTNGSCCGVVLVVLAVVYGCLSHSSSGDRARGPQGGAVETEVHLPATRPRRARWAAPPLHTQAAPRPPARSHGTGVVRQTELVLIRRPMASWCGVRAASSLRRGRHAGVPVRQVPAGPQAAHGHPLPAAHRVPLRHHSAAAARSLQVPTTPLVHAPGRAGTSWLAGC